MWLQFADIGDKDTDLQTLPNLLQEMFCCRNHSEGFFPWYLPPHTKIARSDLSRFGLLIHG